MGDANKTEIEPWTFLKNTEAETYFAKVDLH